MYTYEELKTAAKIATEKENTLGATVIFDEENKMIHIVETRYSDRLLDSKQPGTLMAVVSFPLQQLETILNAKISTDIPHIDMQLFWYKKSEEIIEFINMVYAPSHFISLFTTDIITHITHYYLSEDKQNNLSTFAIFHILRRDVLEDIKEKYGDVREGMIE